jgi:hypothetical protein
MPPFWAAALFHTFAVLPLLDQVSTRDQPDTAVMIPLRVLRNVAAQFESDPCVFVV